MIAIFDLCIFQRFPLFPDTFLNGFESERQQLRGNWKRIFVSHYLKV